MTINIAGTRHGWFEQRSRVLVEGLRALAPDILCLQEVAIRPEPNASDQARLISEAVELNVLAFSPYASRAATRRAEHDGIALLTRWPLRQVDHRFLPHAGHEPMDNRVALFATIATPVRDLHVVTTHLSWRPDERPVRLAQVGVILERVDAYGWSEGGAPVLLAGDFNGVEDEPALSLLRKRYRDAYRVIHPRSAGYTWTQSIEYNTSRPEPSRRLDYVLVSDAVDVASADVVLDRARPVHPSDHAGVCVDFALSNSR